jgi:hypothetical protein
MAQTQEATCRVHAGNAYGTGTCYMADSTHYYILTNAHVVGANNYALVEFFRSGRKGKELTAQVAGKWHQEQSDVDFAVLKVPKSSFGDYPPRIIPLAPRTYRAKAQEYIYSTGCPSALVPQSWQGYILFDNQSRYIFMHEPIGGQSGSGIYVMVKINGQFYTRIAGVLTWRITANSVPVGGAIPISTFYGVINNTYRARTVPISYVPVARFKEYKNGESCHKCGRSYANHAYGTDGRFYCVRYYSDGSRGVGAMPPCVRIQDWGPHTFTSSSTSIPIVPSRSASTPNGVTPLAKPPLVKWPWGSDSEGRSDRLVPIEGWNPQRGDRLPGVRIPDYDRQEELELPGKLGVIREEHVPHYEEKPLIGKWPFPSNNNDGYNYNYDRVSPCPPGGCPPGGGGNPYGNPYGPSPSPGPSPYGGGGGGGNPYGVAPPDVPWDDPIIPPDGNGDPSPEDPRPDDDFTGPRIPEDPRRESGGDSWFSFSWLRNQSDVSLMQALGIAGLTSLIIMLYKKLKPMIQSVLDKYQDRTERKIAERFGEETASELRDIMEGFESLLFGYGDKLAAEHAASKRATKTKYKDKILGALSSAGLAKPEPQSPEVADVVAAAENLANDPTDTTVTPEAVAKIKDLADKMKKE